MAKCLKLLFAYGILVMSIFQAQAANEQLIQRGEYLAIVGDCGACHTQAGKAPFSGGYAIVSPLGTIFSTNITPSKTEGIGNYSEQQFADALRKGVRADGSNLYPAMPYTAYTKLNDEDVAALYANCMQGVQAVNVKPEKTALPFPFNLRFSMIMWNFFFLDTKPFQPDVRQSDEWNRGAYLVQGLTHCSTCHTPRNFLMAEEQDKYLQGASLDTWFAPNITAENLQNKQHWTRENLANYLSTGYASNGATAGGPMLEAINKSFSHMAPDDLKAIATYLLPKDNTTFTPKTLHQWKPVRGDDTPSTKLSEGEQIYRNNCASCHNLMGQGLNGLAALQHNPVLENPNADNVAMAVLHGVWPENGQGMIGFADNLNDQQIANVTNYVMHDIGHSKVQIKEERVKSLRAGGDVSPLMLITRAAMGAAVIIVLIMVYIFYRNRKL